MNKKDIKKLTKDQSIREITKLKTIIPQWFKDNIFDPGSGGDETGAGSPMKIFGMEMSFPSLNISFSGMADKIKSLLPEWLTDPVGYISDLIDDMMSLMPDFLKPEKDVSGMSSEEKAKAIIDIKKKMKIDGKMAPKISNFGRLFRLLG